MVIHWAWNRGNEPCTLIEAHEPGLEILREGAVGLLGEEDEVPRIVGNVRNIFVAADFARVQEVESKCLQTGDSG